jgi:hypothetical protein
MLKTKEEGYERKRQLVWYHKRKDDFRQQVKRMLRSRKEESKRQDRALSLTEDDIRAAWPANNICPVFGVEMVKYGPYAPSLDRIRYDEWYTPKNICVISQRANRIKNNGTALEHRLIADYQDRMSTGGE